MEPYSSDDIKRRKRRNDDPDLSEKGEIQYLLELIPKLEKQLSETKKELDDTKNELKATKHLLQIVSKKLKKTKIEKNK